MVSVSADNVIERAMSLPCWSSPKDATLLEGGITNQNVRVTDLEEDYVVRLGSDIPEHMILRWNELAISYAAHQTGLSPEVVHAEPGILVLRFIKAKALEAKDLHDPMILSEAVQLIRRLHDRGMRELTGPVLSFWVFHIVRTYAGFLRNHGSPHTHRLEKLQRQSEELESRVGRITLVLGHNDLLPANILKGEDRLWLIDWEYGGLNSPLFDLGGLATNAELPKDIEIELLNLYFGKKPDQELWMRYTAMKCASLLREAMWSMVSELTSTLDFDYAAYTRENLERYNAAYAAFVNGSG